MCMRGAEARELWRERAAVRSAQGGTCRDATSTRASCRSADVKNKKQVHGTHLSTMPGSMPYEATVLRQAAGKKQADP